MNKRRTQIPKLGEKLLSFLLPEHKRDILLGDFAEYYLRKADKKGTLYAKAWYWVQLLISIPSFIQNSSYFGGMMIKNYITIAFRNMLKHKSYSFINVSGLAIGVACCIIIFLFVQTELSYDRFHPNAERIYRIVTSTSDDGQPTNANGIFGTGPNLKEYFSEIEDYTRIKASGQRTKTFVGFEENRFYEHGFFYADSNFFSFFNFPIFKGDPNTALTRPNTMVLTRSMASKYFGEEDPLGKVIQADPYKDGNLLDFEVTGVMQDVPPNSHIKFNFLASYNTQRENLSSMGGLEGNYTYVRVPNQAAADKINSQTLEFLQAVWTDNPWYTISLQPLLDIHLKSALKSEPEINGDISYVYAFTIIAVFILVIACINFMNLSTARSTKRAKEVGLRKVVGAHRNQMINQFLSESMIFAIISGVLAILLVQVALPFFNEITGKQVIFNLFSNPVLYIGLPVVVISVGFLAGIYPALFLSGFQPIKVLKGNYISSSSGTLLRKGLVVFQFAISIALIAATAITLKQLDFIRGQNLGYASDQILSIPLNNEMRANFQGFKNEILKQSGVVNATTSSLVPTQGSSHSGFAVEGTENGLGLARYLVDRDFFDTYDIKIIAGRGLERDITQDTANGDFVITELAVQEAEWKTAEEAIGRRVNWRGYEGKITGVVNDLHIYSLRRDLYSMAFYIMPIQYHNYVSIRIQPGNVAGTLAAINSTWSEFSPGYPMDYFFLDDSFQNMHESETKLFKVFIVFSLLAIFVASLGLFGLATYSIEQRVKEIGVRKVLGATATSIVTLLSKDFLKLVIVANLLAWPTAYFIMSKWLEGFAYKTEIGWISFAMATLIAIGIALATISGQSLKAAFMNPAKSLRSE